MDSIPIFFCRKRNLYSTLASVNIFPIIIIIPTYNPLESEFLEFIEKLQKSFRKIIIVNDGSDKRYGRIFKILKTKYTVLEHKENLGKGRALKTAFSYIRDHFPDRGVVTVDSDGQHLIGDIISMAGALQSAGSRGFVLGERDFARASVPFCSSLGNTMTALIIRSFFAGHVRDTQTGLRGVGAHLIEDVLHLDGEKYEYETNMLLYFLENGMAVNSIPIKAVYKEKHQSHFRKLSDSCRILIVVIRRIVVRTVTLLVSRWRRRFGNLRQKI